MDIKKIIKHNVNKFLMGEANFLTGDSDQNPDFLPSPNPVSGDRGAQRIAQAKDTLSDVKDRMRKRGVYDLPELAGVNTLQQLSIEPFRFNIIIQVPEDQQSLDLPDHIDLETVSRVRQVDPLILDFILESEQHGIPANNNTNPYSMEFTEDNELTVNLPGTSRNIRALQSETGSRKGRFYHVRFNMPPFNNPQPNNESIIIAYDLLLQEADKKTVCNGKLTVGQEVTFKKGPHAGKIFIIKEYKNIKSGMVNIQRKSDNKRWSVKCDDLIENVKNPKRNTKGNSNNNSEEPNNNSEEPNNNSNNTPRDRREFLSRIYAKRVDLGPKAIKRRNADVRSYSNRNNNGGNNNWDGNFTSLTTTGVPFTRVELTNPNPQVNLTQLNNTINGNNRTIRLSQQPNNHFIINIGNQTVLDGEIVGNINNFNFYRGGMIRVNPRAGGLITQSFECDIQITR